MKVLDSLKIPYAEEHALAVRLTDRPGALGRATRKLAAAGINITYINGSIVKGQEKALVVFGVAESDLEKAAALSRTEDRVEERVDPHSIHDSAILQLDGRRRGFRRLE